MRDFNLNASFNEFAFARIIDVYNMGRAMQNQKPLITASQGRMLHQALLDNLAQKADRNGNPYRMETATRTVFLDAVNDVLSPIMGEDVIERTPERYRTMYSGYTFAYFNALGWATSGPEADRRRQYGETKAGGMLGVSPFDPRFSTRETILSNGTKVLYVPADDALEFVPNEDGDGYYPQWRNDPDGEQDLTLYEYDLGENETYRPVGSAYTPADSAGLSRIRPYLSENDYRAIAPWMEVSAEDRMTPDGMERSASILQMLQEEGIPYTVSRDRYPGQLKADISNTKISIRLADVRGNEQFLGRVYKDGHAMYIGTRSYRGEQMYVPSNEEIRALIQYAIGEHPDRLNSYSRYSGAKVGSPSVLRQRGQATRTTYISAKDELHTMLGFSQPSDPGEKAKLLSIHTNNNHSDAHLVFQTTEDAETFLREAVSSARANFEKEVNVEYLVQEAQAHAGEPDYVPMFSGDASIAPIQQTYWEVLTGQSDLYRPKEASENEDFRPIFEALGFLDPDTPEEADVDTIQLDNGKELYQGTPEEMVRQHLAESMDVLFGTYEPDVQGVRFHPGMVSAFMDSSYGVYRNNDNLVSAMYKLGFDGSEIRGDDFEAGLIKDRLLRFDETSARLMKDLDSPFMQSMFATIKESVTETACEISDDAIWIDKNGVVRYEARQLVGQQNGFRTIHGMVGQIFEPDAQGVVETHYNGSSNRLFSPGYDAYIVPETEETAGKDLMERVRLRGMEQILRQNLSETIRYDLISNGEVVRDADGHVTEKSVGTTTSVNNTYRGLYATVYPVSIEQQPGESLKDTYVRQAEMTHMPKELLDARFETARGLLHFSKDIEKNSTVSADYFHHMRTEEDDVSVYDLTNDNFMDAYTLTGRSNMAITQDHSFGYTDPVLTGSGTNQGIVRYLAKGATVSSDGKIVPSDNPHARAPLVETAPMRYCDYIPADRVQMVGSNYLTASGVAGLDAHPLRSDPNRQAAGIGMAQLTLQGMTFDDGAVISKEFADAYGVVMENGEHRSLMPGDKICDFAGNKSIVAKVIDRFMSLEEAEAEGVGQAVALFAANPDLDVVQAPYSAVSRFNAASARLLMEHTEDLTLPDGTTKEGCIGFAPVIITHHTAHEHTKQYDDDDVHAGKGRKVSAQLAWAFCAKDARAIMDEVFSGNNSAVSSFREVLNAMGLDMDETGTLRKGYAPHVDEDRYIFRLPDAETIAHTPEPEIVKLFSDSVDTRGGFLELPFPMELPSGVQTQVVPKDQSAYPDRTMYALPVMSSHMRSGQTFEDGTSMTHDYTNQYVRIFKSAVDYLKADAADNAAGRVKAMEDAKTSYASITESLRNRKFDTKHNAMRDDFMAHRMPHSATAVWTPDPKLDLDCIAMSSDMMHHLGVKKDDHILVWRDPILRDTGARYMRVTPDDTLVGVAVHPLVASPGFDGDFDGDSVGLLNLFREDAKQEAMDKFSYEMNLLDTTKIRPNGDYALMLNDSMDVISAEFLDEQKKAQAGEDYGPTLKERRMELEHRANEVYRSDLPLDEKVHYNREILYDLSTWARNALMDTCGTEVISYKDLPSHAASLSNIVEHGAKGSYKKLGDYFKYFGATFETDADGKIRPDTMQDAGHTLATEQDVADTELATAIKAHGTGNAGMVSQRVVTVLRNLGVVDHSDPANAEKQNTLSGALKITYLSTQGLLQAKHDPIQAKRLYEMVQEPVRNIWRGRAMEARDLPDENGQMRRHWMVQKTYNANGESVPVQATKEEWIRTFLDIHENKDGLDLAGNINPEHVRQVADALCDPNTGRMYDIEDPQVVHDIAAPMDILAYRTKDAFATICQMAEEHRNIFEGTYNQMFAPKQIRENMQAAMEGRPLQAISSRDVQTDYNPVRKGKSPISLETEHVVQPLEPEVSSASYAKADVSAEEQHSDMETKTVGFDFRAPAEPIAAAEPEAHVERTVPDHLASVAEAYEQNQVAGPTYDPALSE